MDYLSNLFKLGKVGGVPGLALGCAVIVLVAVLGLTDTIPDAWRGPLLVMVALGAVVFVVVALTGWGRNSRPGDQIAHAKGNRAPAYNYAGTGVGGRQEAKSEGDDAPAINIKRDG